MRDGPGRFAQGAQSALVEAFFESDLDVSIFEPGREYTKLEMANLLGVPSTPGYGITVKQVTVDDGKGDYWLRAYVWNSGSFMLSEDVRFVVDANGNGKILNYSVIPQGAENFDFIGGGLLALIGNTVMEPLIDPWKIGKTVNIEFIGSAPAGKTYTKTDY